MKHMDYPYSIGPDGRTALADEDNYIRDLIEQVLFTSPGERVNRPSFGSGLLQLVFAGQDDGLAHATQALVQGALQQWLGDLIQVEAVQVESEDARLNVTVQYSVRRSQRRQVAQFVREV
jgi:phage baseplate assembly protein W